MERSEISPAAAAKGLALEGEQLRRSPASSVEINLRGKWQERQEIYAEKLISGRRRFGSREQGDDAGLTFIVPCLMYMYPKHYCDLL